MEPHAVRGCHASFSKRALALDLDILEQAHASSGGMRGWVLLWLSRARSAGYAAIHQSPRCARPARLGGLREGGSAPNPRHPPTPPHVIVVVIVIVI